MEDDAGEDAAGVDTQAAGREEVVAVLIGTDACRLYLCGWNTRGLELQLAAAPQVDVPMLLP